MLKGERVVLRPMVRTDCETRLNWWHDVELELLGGGDPPMPRTLEGALKRFDADAEVEPPTSAYFMVDADAKTIGFIGIHHFNWTDRTCLLGIVIGDRKYWSRGYGRESIELLLDYVFRIRNIRKVNLFTNSDNLRAIRCYSACGFVEEGRLRQQFWSDGKYVDQVHMGILKEEWESRTKSG